MKVKRGLEYELITKMIFEQILMREDLRTVDVKHDVTLKGLTTTHQIDVYWTFEIGRIFHTVIVQVKDWNSPVTQGELLKFRAVLNDLPNQPRGVFVTRTGYQKGAREVAEANGILLYELRPIGKSGSKRGLVIGFFELHFSTVEHNSVRVIPDEEWLKNKGFTIR